MNKTKVIVTVGPTTASKDILKSLIISGADVVRINMSYATFDFCRDVIGKINEINRELKTYVGIMLDTRGPLVRIGHISDGKALLKYDDKIRIFMHDVIGDTTKFSVDYSNLVDDVSIGNIIKVNDTVELQVIDKGRDYLLCKVNKEGYIEENSSIIMPNLKLHKEFLNSFDRQTIKFASDMNVDFLTLSYVSSHDDVLEANDLLIELGNEHLQIISKIENAEALEDIDRIIKVSDGVMIDRSLSYEIAMERIPGIQKRVINKCHEKGAIGIVTTELSIMNDGPTRAEVSDIANAILDGIDAISLCGLATLGKYSLETLRSLERIISVAEKDINYDVSISNEDNDITSSIAYSVANCAYKLNCKAIFTPTISGYTAKKMSRFRPICPIIAVSPNIDTVKSLTLNFGVYPLLINEMKSYDAIIEKSKKIAMEFLMLHENDKIIITGGYPFKKVKHTNFMKIEEL